jgi:hypothetical protein
MPSTRTRGITVDARGDRTISKEYRGERIFLRLGAVAQEDAEHRLLVEIDHLELAIERRKHARPLFSDCAKRFLLESKNKRSATAIAWHVRMLLRSVGDLEVRRVHDETLRPLVEGRLAEGVSATTVNRTFGGCSRGPTSCRTRLPRRRRPSVARNGGTPHHNAARVPSPGASDHLGGAGRDLSALAGPSGAHGPLRRQHRTARRESVRVAVVFLGGSYS